MPRDVWLDDDGKQLLVPAKLGRLLKIKGHRLLVGTPVTAHLVLRADGHWYALIGCETTPQDAACGEAHPTQADCEHAAIGLDAGLKVFLADAEGAVVENPRHYRRGQQCLAKAQHVSDRRRTKGSHRRRTKGSHRRRTAKHAGAVQHRKIARQRRVFHFKTAKQDAERYGRIGVEDLNITAMVQTHQLAKSSHDASWSAFLAILTAPAPAPAPAARAGHGVVRVPARFTSPKCSRCGAYVQKSLSVRTHIGPSCGLVEDRDVNAAKNSKQAGALPSGTGAAGLPGERRRPRL